MKIQELERLTGSDRATIRFYEKEGLLTPRRLENGYRDYSEADAEELKRILLLRELGVTIETIRKLQQGSADFTQVMDQQAKILASRSQQMKQASHVCRMISGDSAAYKTLNTAHYHTLLSTPQLPAGEPTPVSTFQEPLKKEEPHPWRRYFARMIDHSIINALVFFIAVVLLRWRPVGNFMIAAIGIFSWILLIPVETALLHLCGTTPGKWMMGIQIERYEGGWLSWHDAFDRTWRAVAQGVGFGIPILQDILLLVHYCHLTGRSMRRFQRYDDMAGPMEMDWDGWFEVSYQDVEWKGVWTAVLTEAVCVFLIFLASIDGILPIYRGNDLKISEFSKNYNMYSSVMENNARTMLSDGSFPEKTYTTYANLSDGRNVLVDPFWEFEYETEGETITGISDHHQFYDFYTGYDYFMSYLDGDAAQTSDSSGIHWLSADHKNAMIAMAAAQPGMTPKKLQAFMEEMNEWLRLPAEDGIQWEYGNLMFRWKIDAELYYSDETGQYSPVYDVTLDFEIQVS